MARKRYGRNQKRKHRQEIAKWKQAYEISNGVQDSVSRKLREAQDTIDSMIEEIERICLHSSVIPPKTVNGESNRDQLRVPCFEDIRPFAPHGITPSTATLRTVNVYALRSFINDHREQFQLAVHLAYSAGGHSVYMISEEALACKSKQDLVNWLVPGIAKALIRHISR